MYSSRCVCVCAVALCASLTAAVVILSVRLGSRTPRHGHSEQQRVRLDQVGVAGLKLTAGNQQDGEGTRFDLNGGAGVRVEGNLLLPCGDLLHRTGDVLQDERARSETRRKLRHTFTDTHLPLLVANFDQQNLQRHRVLLVLAVLRRFS